MPIETERERNTNAAHLLLREVWSAGDLALIDELVAANHVHHDPLLPEPIEGRAALKEWVKTVREGAPDLTKTVDGTFVDGETVVLTYTTTGTNEGEIMGAEPTGRPFEVDGVYVHHIRDGLLEETQDVWDAFGLFAQLGAFPEVNRA